MGLDELWTAGWYFGVFFSGFLLFATGMKAWDVWKARHWIPVPGKVVRTGITQQRRRGKNPSDKQIGNYPEVIYEYDVGGRTLRGNRVNVTPLVADVEVEPVLNRYPVGSEVTVYYNPKDPQESVLERNWPRGLGLGVLGLIAAIAVVSYVVPWLMIHTGEELSQHLPVPSRAGMIVFAGAGCIFLLWLMAALRAQQTAALEWPNVKGKIVRSRIEAFRDRDGTVTNPRISFRAVILYQYRVNDRLYQSDRINFGGRSTGRVRSVSVDRPDVPIVDYTDGRASAFTPPRGMVELVQRFPEGEEIDVYYDPAQPTSAVLDPLASGTQWVLIAVALGCVAVALWAAFG